MSHNESDSPEEGMDDGSTSDSGDKCDDVSSIAIATGKYISSILLYTCREFLLSTLVMTSLGI